MKKSSFITLVMATVSGLLFAIGMCMALLPEWNAFSEGIIFGGAGVVLGLITLLVWRKAENKKPIKFTAKGIIAVLVGIVSALVLGIGMCFCMVWENIALGILIGIVGIVGLLSLIPIVVGFKK